MKLTLSKSVSTIIIALSLVGSALADIRYKLKLTQGRSTTETTKLIKGRRERTEQTGSAVSIVFQCDPKRRLMINAQTRKYFIAPLNKDDASPANTGGATTSAPIRKGGTIARTLTTTDLGERKQMFGYTARHLKITYLVEPSPEACDQHRVHWESEGWYIDLDADFVCPPDAERLVTCHDKNEIKRLGITTQVFPLIETFTQYNAAGNPTFTRTKEVVELSTEPLDASLFDVPREYIEAKSLQELYQSSSSSGIKEKP